MPPSTAVGACRIELARGDITREETDAIANAANEGLRGGGGVDGAIHRAAGPDLKAACLAIPEVRPGVRCPTGEARATPAFRLKAKWVIHTAGPVWRGGGRGEADLLAACYRSCLRAAAERGCASISFPSISTGVYGYPVDEAARVALASVGAFLQEVGRPALVRFVLFDDATFAAYRAALG